MIIRNKTVIHIDDTHDVAVEDLKESPNGSVAESVGITKRSTATELAHGQLSVNCWDT
jgi:hypothetical protein